VTNRWRNRNRNFEYGLLTLQDLEPESCFTSSFLSHRRRRLLLKWARVAEILERKWLDYEDGTGERASSREQRLCLAFGPEVDLLSY